MVVAEGHGPAKAELSIAQRPAAGLGKGRAVPGIATKAQQRHGNVGLRYAQQGQCLAWRCTAKAKPGYAI